MACVGRCGIYATRPQFCQDYPKVTDFVPSGCTYSFLGSERTGTCQPEVCQENICCAYPREAGEPEGVSLDSLAGGRPCKHLVWQELPHEKSASHEDGESVLPQLYSLVTEALTGW
jgi:hypothetical protein